MSEPPVAPIASPRIAYLRRRAARALQRIAVAVIGIPFLAGLALALGEAMNVVLDHWFAQVFLLCGAAAFLLSATAVALNRSFFATAGVLRRVGDELVIERRSRRAVPLAAIEAGFVVPTRQATHVELHLKGGDVIDAQVAGDADAAALLRAARVDVARQRCRIPLVDPNARLFLGLAIAGGMAYVTTPVLSVITAALTRLPMTTAGLLWAALIALVTAAVMRVAALPEVTIGTDGIAFKRGLRETFVPFEELAEIRPAGLGLLVRYRSGRTLEIFSPAGVGPERFEALMRRIREAMAARAQGHQPALELLDRRGRSVTAWRVALAELARRGTSYRDVGLSIDDLEAVLSSPDATAERRLAAAVALRATPHAAATSLIRVAAAQCASQRLRAALEKVSAGADDDAALAEALAEGEIADARAARLTS